MPPSSAAGRLFTILLVVAIPPLVALAVTASILAGGQNEVGIGTILLVMTLLTAAWAGIIALLAQAVGLQPTDVLRLATRGQLDVDDPHASALAPVAAALVERNLQIAELARRSRSGVGVPDLRAAVEHVIQTACVVTRDPVWALAVLSSEHSEVPAGVYRAGSISPEPISDVHRWAATSEPTEEYERAGHITGPWGAFLAIDVIATLDLRATLMTPREGQPAPSVAERDLLTLIGEYATATIEHSLLLRQVRAQAEDLDRMADVQRDFLRGVTHDLQAPLTSIRALAVETGALIDDPQAREDLETISHQADRLSRMVAQLLAMSRLEAGVLEPRQEVFRAEPIVRRAWAAMRSDRPFALTQAGVPHLLSGDPDRFEQVVWALLDNAVRYSSSESAVNVHITTEARDDALLGRVAVEDRGIGISEDDRSHAFDQFFRAPDARAFAPNGSGIGLYTAKGLISAMGGRIGMESRPGVGTTVTVILPAEEERGEL